MIFRIYKTVKFVLNEIQIAYYAIAGTVPIITIEIDVYYKLCANNTIAQTNNLSNISGLDLNKISKYKIKMDNGKTVQNDYGHTLAVC